MRPIAYYAIVFSLLWPAAARADHPSVTLGRGLSGPIITLQPSTLPRGHFAFTFRTELVRFDTRTDAELRSAAARADEIDDLDVLFSPAIGVAYGASDALTVGARFPYLLRTDVRAIEFDHGVAETRRQGRAAGIGDLALFTQYRLVHLIRFELAAIGGVKLATGQTGRKDRFGARFEPEHQPGTGSLDPIAGLAVRRLVGAVALDANLQYTNARVGTEHTDVGDLWSINVAATRRFGGASHSHDEQVGRAGSSPGDHTHRFVDLVAELNTEARGRHMHDGEREGNTGGTVVYLSPGVRVSVSDRSAMFVSVAVPVVNHPNGFEHRPRMRIVFGMSMGL